MSSQTVESMASVPFEDQFRCCICLDIYTDPVSIPCGHNFCLDCIEGYWDTKEKSECPLCKETFKERPELRINRDFSDVIEFLKRSLLPTPIQKEAVEPLQQQLSESGVVPCDVCHGNKAPSVKSCLVCQASYCDIHLTPHQRDPALQKHRLTDPATFTSSHLCRKHNKPLTMLSDLFQMNLRETKSNIHQMIQARLKKMEEIKSSADLSKKVTEKEIQSCSQICSMLITTIERQQAELVRELEDRQLEAEKKAEDLLKELEKEIHELQKRSSELQHLELTPSPLHLLQSFPSLSRLPTTREWSEVAVHSDNSVGTVRRAVSRLGDMCQELANTLSAEEVDNMNKYSVNVTLDPETASGWLVLSADGKKVSLTNQKKKTPLPDNPQRFDSCVCILGKQSFTSGRRYWVVQVGDKTDWDLGVAQKSINRKGAIMVRPDSGYWAICRRKGGSLSACTGPSVTLNLYEIPKKVGIFLDYEEGSVSFYNAEAKTHIYTYSRCSFREPLYPYFNPCVQHNGRNVTPLVICPLGGGVREEQDTSIESAV
ncbi:nuclear factor 7, ovary-like [Archocentrus centrarchus]|uniref:nuclear factor 7, ovary-like n=1 Tax=Archocentrus centrarchus TaxID=63155 RepID=UPI0011E9B33E|nr:nuclear factor 7, ovary-like [Archocentrus centrarchus]